MSLRSIASMALRSFDAFNNMSQTSQGNHKELQNIFRRDYYNNYNLTDDLNKVKTESKQQAVCALTQQPEKLKLAHLVPVSTSCDIRATLKLSGNEIWSFRNALLLSWNIKAAYDRKRLSFVEVPLHIGHYCLQIWDESVKYELIFENAKVMRDDGDNMIGFYEGKFLNLNLDNNQKLNPFRRCLSYQALVSFLSSDEVNAPTDFSSLTGEELEEWERKKEDILMFRSNLDRVIEEEVDDEDG